MHVERLSLYGPVAALLFVLTIALLPLLIPGYDSARQTVSEIGQVGSPARLPFTMLLLTVSVFQVVFAIALSRFGRDFGLSTAPAYLAGSFALSMAGAVIFAYPHPLHNIFGLSELIGYQAPLLLCLAWRKAPKHKTLVRFSRAMAAAVWVVILINLIPLFRPASIWPLIRSEFGLIQRALFVTYFVWVAGLGLFVHQYSKCRMNT